ncbi:hypothetical protein [Parasporobacterium paucivorans]|uniref:Uncharacterized protein n=1 Tax=Parasporobacterium paucivorans DSM 15970 TaxID=1122934 RepID=A0A1M6B3Y7_9FIRM|nr:hypothetical protein [Parasporobacterium paucivorans]SHI43377.1 hypothetical protein SAMN02745691_00252 [Parasporobacterium paucivorans DSM 15970]
MSEYKGCEFCKYQDKDDDEMPCVECSHAYSSEFEPIPPKTNGEAIRESNESLAEFIDKATNESRDDWYPVGCRSCIYYKTHHTDKTSKFYECGDCCWKDGILAYFNQPAEEKENEE